MKRKKRSSVLKVALPSITISVIFVSVILLLFVFSPNYVAQPPAILQSIGDSPNAVSVNPSTNTLYVANFADNTVSVIDGKLVL